MKSNEIQKEFSSDFLEANFQNIFQYVFSWVSENLTPFPVFQFNLEGQILSANPNAQRLLAHKTIDYISDLIPDFSLEVLSNCILEGSIIYKTHKILNRSFQFIAKGAPDLQIGLIYGIDITDRIKTEERLKAKEEFLRKVIDANPNLIFVKDANGRFILANQTVANIYGTTIADIVGRRDSDFNSNQEEVESFCKDDLDVINYQKEIFIAEECVTAADNSVHWLQTVKRPVCTANNEVHVLGVATDITALKRLQEQLYQSQKMEAIGQLASGIAHDLNNALGAVVGHLQLIQDTFSLPNEVIKSIDIALNGCSRASGLIEQLLGFSRQGQYNLTYVDLISLINETVQFLGRIIGPSIKIKRQSTTSNFLVHADIGQLQQALTNIIINATQAMPSGGTITFNCESITVDSPESYNSSAKPGEYIKLSIADSGQGISQKYIDKIFEPFFSTKGEGNGSGLGLSMVYGILQSHGGWVTVSSQVGHGAVFDLFIPRAKNIVKAAAPLNSLALSPLKDITGRVLVIDDEENLVELTLMFLKKNGIEGTGFVDPLAALDWYQTNYGLVDLIILDMRMPKLHGKDCFEALRFINPEAHVVILSGYSRNESAQRVLNKGALHFFQKPLKYPDLMEWIKNFLSEKYFRTQNTFNKNKIANS